MLSPVPLPFVLPHPHLNRLDSSILPCLVSVPCVRSFSFTLSSGSTPHISWVEKEARVSLSVFVRDFSMLVHSSILLLTFPNVLILLLLPARPRPNSCPALPRQLVPPKSATRPSPLSVVRAQSAPTPLSPPHPIHRHPTPSPPCALHLTPPTFRPSTFHVPTFELTVFSTFGP